MNEGYEPKGLYIDVAGLKTCEFASTISVLVSLGLRLMESEWLKM